MTKNHDAALSRKLAFLSDPAHYPDAPDTIETVETHFAWVFLSRRLVYKLKKPIRFQNIDFTSLAARRANCELEITLNRRLAEAVYIGAVPLTIAAEGLALDGEGEPVDWLVKMHRLPRERMLDVAATTGEITDQELTAVITKLCRYYRVATRAPWDGTAYRTQLARRTRRYAQQLSDPELGLDTALIDRLCALQLRFIDQHTTDLDRRVASGRVIDAHGDLRPEHIYLSENPQIIDCLEFSTELRWLDSAEEIAFLAVECERVGQTALASRAVAGYCAGSPDHTTAPLLRFYRAQRAFIRALLSAWHIPGAKTETDARRWRERTAWYLDAVEQCF